MRGEFAESRANEHERLIAALMEACEFCQSNENREKVIETLAGSNYLDTSQDAIRSSLLGPFRFRKTASKLQGSPTIRRPGS